MTDDQHAARQALFHVIGTSIGAVLLAIPTGHLFRESLEAVWFSSWWWLPVLLFIGSWVVGLLWVASRHLCEPFGTDPGVSLAVAIALACIWWAAFRGYYGPIGHGPYRERVMAAPESVSWTAEVEWTEDASGEPEYSRLHMGKGQTLDLSGCEGKYAPIRMRCEDETGRAWQIVSDPR